MRNLSTAVVVLLALACAACGPSVAGLAGTSTPEPAKKTFAIGCDDAHRYAARSLKERGYRLTSIDRGAGGGTLDGKKESGDHQRISLTCGGGGVNVATSGGGAWADQGLWFTFNQIVEFGDRVWPPPTSPVVKVESISGIEAKLEFPGELEPLGMVALRVRVFNGGTRAIRIDPRRIKARTDGKGGAIPLGEAGVKERLGAVDPAIDSKLLKRVTLKQGEEVRGFVFFPVAQYTSAVVMVIDDQTGEADEFEVFFQTG